MTARKIISLVLAIVTAYIIVRVAFWVLGLFFSLVWFLLGVAVVSVVAYLLYNKIDRMLAGSRRLK